MARDFEGVVSRRSLSHRAPVLAAGIYEAAGLASGSADLAANDLPPALSIFTVYKACNPGRCLYHLNCPDRRIGQHRFLMDSTSMKAALRKSVQARLKTLTTADVKQRSASIQSTLLAHPQFQKAYRIGIYLSMPNGEASTQGIVEHALNQGKEVFVPHLYNNPGVSMVEGGVPYKPKRIMNMVSLSSIDDYRALQRDKWGIPTPAANSIPHRKHVLGEIIGNDAPQRSGLQETLDLIVMPGVAFDRGGKRLGHGRGFYDFFLEEYRSALASSGSDSASSTKFPQLVALALPEQVLPPGEDIPTEDHDCKIDAIFTVDETILP